MRGTSGNFSSHKIVFNTAWYNFSENVCLHIVYTCIYCKLCCLLGYENGKSFFTPLPTPNLAPFRGFQFALCNTQSCACSLVGCCCRIQHKSCSSERAKLEIFSSPKKFPLSTMLPSREQSMPIPFNFLDFLTRPHFKFKELFVSLWDGKEGGKRQRWKNNTKNPEHTKFSFH